MRRKTQIVTIDTERLNTFSREVQRAFVAVSLHVDWLLQQTHLPYEHRTRPGSDSWLPQQMAPDPKVVVKTLAWDKRMNSITNSYTHAEAGVIVLLRDSFLTKEDMRVVFEEYGDFYHPCPPAPLYAVAPQRDKAFQMILIPLGSGCNLFDLPGVDEDAVQRQLEERLTADYPGDGMLVGPSDANDEVLTGSSDAMERQPRSLVEPDDDYARVVEALSEIMQRAAI